MEFAIIVKYIITVVLLLYRSIKMFIRFLFAFFTLLFFVSVPFEAAAASSKESRKEKRERRRREKSAKSQQKKNEQLQGSQKIAAIRERIKSAPEKDIPSEFKPILLNVLSDFAQTQIGKQILDKVHPSLKFKISEGKMRYHNHCIADNALCISLDGSFTSFVETKTQAEKLFYILEIADFFACEATKSILYNEEKDCFPHTSLEEAVTAGKLLELNAALNQTSIRYQIGNLPKYRNQLQTGARFFRKPVKGKTNLEPLHLLYRDLVNARKAAGVNEIAAERFARTKLAELLWKNNAEQPIKVGKRVITPKVSYADTAIRNWSKDYTLLSAENAFILRNRAKSKRNAKESVHLMQNFIGALNVDISPAFFRNQNYSSFKVLSPNVIAAYENGRKDVEINMMSNIMTKKMYSQGKIYQISFVVRANSKTKKGGKITEYYMGTQNKCATYTVGENYVLNGLYCEYDRQGNKTMEVPATGCEFRGTGWILENGVRRQIKYPN